MVLEYVMSCEWAFINIPNDDVQIIDKHQHKIISIC